MGVFDVLDVSKQLTMNSSLTPSDYAESFSWVSGEDITTEVKHAMEILDLKSAVSLEESIRSGRETAVQTSTTTANLN